jgi:hypothetical protein
LTRPLAAPGLYLGRWPSTAAPGQTQRSDPRLVNLALLVQHMAATGDGTDTPVRSLLRFPLPAWRPPPGHRSSVPAPSPVAAPRPGARGPEPTALPAAGFETACATRVRPARVVLDVGCGIRPQPIVVPEVHVCCEPYGEYVARLQADVAARDDRAWLVLQADWAQAVALFPPRSVDTVFLLDVIEHLDKETSLRLLRATERIAREQVVVFTTLGFLPQHHPDGRDAWGMGGGTWQEHRSGWEPADFGPGWEVLVAHDFHTHDNKGRPHAAPHGALWAIYEARAERRAERAAPTRAPVTVGIAVPEGGRTLAACLEAIAPNLRPGDEIVIADGGAGEAALATAYAFAARHPRSTRVLAGARTQAFAAHSVLHAAARPLVLLVPPGAAIPPRFLDEAVALLATQPPSSAVAFELASGEMCLLGPAEQLCAASRAGADVLVGDDPVALSARLQAAGARLALVPSSEVAR